MNTLLHLKILEYMATNYSKRLVVVFIVMIIMVFPQELSLFNCLKFFLVLAFTQLLFWYLLLKFCMCVFPPLIHTLLIISIHSQELNTQFLSPVWIPKFNFPF